MPLFVQVKVYKLGKHVSKVLYIQFLASYYISFLLYIFFKYTVRVSSLVHCPLTKSTVNKRFMATQLSSPPRIFGTT